MWRYEAFLEEGAALVKRSQQLRAESAAVWEYRHGTRPHLPGNSFLVSRENPRQHRRSRSSGINQGRTKDTDNASTVIDDLNALLGEDTIQDELDDQEAIVSVAHAADDDTVLYEFHIVFHAIYQTPALFFRLTRVDGTPVLFTDELMRDLRLPGGNAQAALVAMDDHQVLGTPFYLLHPCETASAMALLLDQPPTQVRLDLEDSPSSVQVSHGDQETSRRSGSPRYLLAWLSLVQPLTHINPVMY